MPQMSSPEFAASGNLINTCYVTAKGIQATMGRSKACFLFARSGFRLLTDPLRSDHYQILLDLSPSRATCLALGGCGDSAIHDIPRRSFALAAAVAAAAAAVAIFGSNLGRLCAVCWRSRRELPLHDFASVSSCGWCACS